MTGTQAELINVRGESYDRVVPDARVWLDGPLVSATHVGVRGYQFPAYQAPCAASVDAYVVTVYIAGSTSIRRAIDSREECSQVGPGDISLQPPLLCSRWGWENTIDVLQVHVDPTHLQDMAVDELGAIARLEMRHGLRVRDEVLVRMGLDLMDELLPPRPFASSRSVRALGERFVIHLLRHHFDLAPTTRPHHGLGSQEVATLRALVAERLGKELRLVDMAQAVGLGVHHFGRVFKTTFGRSPHDYVIEHRLARARDLLLETSSSISEIASETGFADQSHLTRQFSRRFGVPPARLRRRARDGS